MKARLRLVLTDRGGAPVAERVAHNAVMRTGAELVARLFAGVAGATPITHMGVGTSDAPESDAFTTTALSNADPALTGDTEAAIAADAFTITTDPDRRAVVVRVRATLPDSAAQGTIREAGLLGRTGADPAVLYNRVIFAPIDKGDDHELTLFWEITFPYGDLHTLA
jgi:hypothetical protein